VIEMTRSRGSACPGTFDIVLRWYRCCWALSPARCRRRSGYPCDIWRNCVIAPSVIPSWLSRYRTRRYHFRCQDRVLDCHLEELFYIRPAGNYARCQTVRNQECHHPVSARLLLRVAQYVRTGSAILLRIVAALKEPHPVEVREGHQEQHSRRGRLRKGPPPEKFIVEDLWSQQKVLLLPVPLDVGSTPVGGAGAFAFQLRVNAILNPFRARIWWLLKYSASRHVFQQRAQSSPMEIFEKVTFK